MGLATVLNLKPLGFFIPYRYAGEIPDKIQRAEYQELLPLFQDQLSAFQTIIQQAESHISDLKRIGGEPPPAPRFDQDWFPTLDAVAAYTLIREHKPGRILEVGSGHSTRFFVQAVHDGGFETAITAIDPAPRAVIEGLPITFCRMTLQDAYLSGQLDGLLATLCANDVVSIDSSHILMPGTDVDMFLSRLLPKLPTGMLIHIHDIFLPDPYPVRWQWRGYNEQNAVATLIQSTDYEILFASHFVATEMIDRLSQSVISSLAKKPSGLPASLWLRKT